MKTLKPTAWKKTPLRRIARNVEARRPQNLLLTVPHVRTDILPYHVWRRRPAGWRPCQRCHSRVLPEYFFRMLPGEPVFTSLGTVETRRHEHSSSPAETRAAPGRHSDDVTDRSMNQSATSGLRHASSNFRPDLSAKPFRMRKRQNAP